jgi:hypothetical protein
LKIFLESQLTYEGSHFAEEHGFDEERFVVSHDRSGALGGYQILLAKLGTGDGCPCDSSKLRAGLCRKARLAETREDDPGQTRACALSRPMSALSHERT